jgi:hypothetical protein
LPVRNGLMLDGPGRLDKLDRWTPRAHRVAAAGRQSAELADRRKSQSQNCGLPPDGRLRSAEYDGGACQRAAARNMLAKSFSLALGPFSLVRQPYHSCSARWTSRSGSPEPLSTPNGLHEGWFPEVGKKWQAVFMKAAGRNAPSCRMCWFPGETRLPGSPRVPSCPRGPARALCRQQSPGRCRRPPH